MKTPSKSDPGFAPGALKKADAASRSQEHPYRPMHDTLPGLEIEGIGLGPLRLEDLVDREALGEMAGSFHRLFGVPVRVVSAAGTVLADAASHAPICRYVNEHVGGRRACNLTVASVKSTSAAIGQSHNHSCFTGAVYRVIPIEYDRRAIGRVVLGPYLPADAAEVPAALLAVDPHIDRGRAAELLPRMPLTNTRSGILSRLR